MINQRWTLRRVIQETQLEFTACDWDAIIIASSDEFIDCNECFSWWIEWEIQKFMQWSDSVRANEFNKFIAHSKEISADQLVKGTKLIMWQDKRRGEIQGRIISRKRLKTTSHWISGWEIATTLNSWSSEFDCDTTRFYWWVLIQWNQWLTSLSICSHWSICSISYQYHQRSCVKCSFYLHVKW